ncbi:hypothetical protein Tco_0844678 [Tanacetum coccineum]
MASLDHRLNPLFSIKECMTCGALYTADFYCSKGGLKDKILVPKPPQNCATCGNAVDGLYCRSCAFMRRCWNEGWYTIHDENEILNTFESSNDNTNVTVSFVNNVLASLMGTVLILVIIVHHKFRLSLIQNNAIKPLLSSHRLANVHNRHQYDDENSFTYDSKPNSLNDFPSVLTHPPQFQFETYLCELCGNNAHYGYDCPPRFPLFPVNYHPQETSREILQAQEDLMEAIQAFLKEYDHIPPNEKCMALLLAEERFLKIKQTMREEQNQPEILQELLLKLMDDLQILKGSQQEKKETAAQSFIPYWNSSMIDDEKARDNFLKYVYTLLRKFSRISFGVTPKVILIAWESFGKIKDALMDKQYRQEDIQELMSKLLEDVRNISEEFSEYINCPSWNRPLFYFDGDDDEYTFIRRRPKVITPVLSTKEPVDSLIMGDEQLDTIPEKESDEIIKSSVKNIVPIPSGSEDFSDNESKCDVPECDETSPTFTTFSNPLFDSNDDFTSSDDESLSDEDVPMENFKIYSNPLFDDEEIISTKIDSFDFLFEEFSGELAHIDPIPPGIEKADFDLEEEIRLVENLLYDNSSPRPSEELNLEIADTILESLSLHLLSPLRIVTLLWRRSMFPHSR